MTHLVRVATLSLFACGPSVAPEPSTAVPLPPVASASMAERAVDAGSPARAKVDAPTQAPTIEGVLLRLGTTKVTGKLSTEVVARVVQESFVDFRSCYEAGLRNNPTLTGRTAVSFTITSAGAVVGARDAGTDLTDASVFECVLRRYEKLTFPPPESGTVTVMSPIVFNPPEK